MRRELFAAAVLTALVGGAAQAQNDTGNYRRFTDDVGDTNRSNRIVYAPIGTAYPGARPARQPYEQASAAWYLQPVGASGVRPSKVLDDARYTLERFELLPGGQSMRVVISRTGGPAEPAPELRVVNTETQITSRAPAEAIAGGRYTFTVRAPHDGLGAAFEKPAAARYEIRFMASRQVAPPPSIARKGSFGGESPRLTALTAPPQLPRAERVAGRRIEYRSAKGPGVVVEDRVAGSRQELRKRR